ncbi:hypothetical protein PoHVEF18_008103 [Penicillium ochrochloron]
MSGLEVIGGISAIITLLDGSINVYDSARNDMKLPETFESVRRRLPVILHILQACQNDLERGKDSMPSDICQILENILDACHEKARKLREIFEMVIPGEKDTWEKRYAKVIGRLGKGNNVEELMVTLTQDVQLIVNNNAVNSVTLEQNVELEEILKEMKSVQSSSSGEAQTTNINSGQQIKRNAYVGTENFQSVSLRQKEDFSFRGPVGICLGQAPYIASELFVGRGYELDEIAKALDPNHKAQTQQRLVLGGMGGIGKTQLAIAHAKSGRGSYSSVFWLNAVSQATLNDSFRWAANIIFDIEDSGVLNDEELVRRVHQWLCAPKNTGWLLIFDNYDDPDQFRIEPYYPPACHGAIIVTTRRPALVAGIALDIKPLQNIEDSLEILQTRSKRENVQSDPHAKRLAERLAGLPLALASAGMYLHYGTITFEHYLQEYEKRWNINPRRPIQLQEYQERTLYTTWNLSYSRLEKEDPDAAKMLKLLAYFDNQRLWYELFRAGIADSSPEWLREVITDDVVFNGVMGVLAEYYFLDVHQASESWSMHNSVHDWTLAALNKDIDAKNYWYAFDCISASISGENANSFANLLYSPLAAHATRLVHQRFCKNDIMNNIPTHQLHQASLIGNLLREQVLLLPAERMYQHALAGYENALGADHTSTLDTVNNLGILYRDQGKLDQAEQMYQRALAGYEKALGVDHTSTLNTVNNLGNLYRNQGKLDQAEQMYQRALAGREKALGADHTSTLNTVNNLGVLYVDQGKLDQAEQMYQRALAGYEKALGLDQAEQMYQRALAGRANALGADHTTTLDTVNSLGILYQDQGKLDQAEQMYHRAGLGKEKNNTDVQMMETRKQVLGLEHSDALDLSLGAVSYNNHVDLGDSDSSIENDSVFSVPVSIPSTRTLESGRGEMNLLLIQELANLLHEDGVLFSLILVGISKELIGFERMRNNFRRLLKHFANSLREDILSESHRDLRSFVSSYSAMITRELFAMTHIDEERKLEPQALRAEHRTASVENRLVHERKVESYLQSLHRGGTAPQTNEAMEVFNSDDEESDQGSVAEEAGEDEPYEGSLQNLNQMKSFILESAAYHVLRRRLEEFVQPSLYSRLRDLVNRWSIPEHKNHGDAARYKLRNFVSELKRVSPHEIHIERDQNISRFVGFVGHYQYLIERWTREPWDWWPFPRCPRPLAESETRLRWKCVSIKLYTAPRSIDLGSNP